MTCRWMRESMPDIPLRRSGLTAWVSDKRSGKSAGTASTSPTVRPSRPSCRMPANPRVVGASLGAEKNRCTVPALGSSAWGSTSTIRKMGDWHSGTGSSSSGWSA